EHTRALLPQACRNACLACLFFQSLEILFRRGQFLLLSIELFLILRIFLVPGALITETVAGVGVERGGAQLIFALHHIELARKQIHLVALVGNFVFPLLVLGLAFFRFIAISRFFSGVGGFTFWLRFGFFFGFRVRLCF